MAIETVSTQQPYVLEAPNSLIDRAAGSGPYYVPRPNNLILPNDLLIFVLAVASGNETPTFSTGPVGGSSAWTLAYAGNGHHVWYYLNSSTNTQTFASASLNFNTAPSGTVTELIHVRNVGAVESTASCGSTTSSAGASSGTRITSGSSTPTVANELLIGIAAIRKAAANTVVPNPGASWPTVDTSIFTYQTTETQFGTNPAGPDPYGALSSTTVPGCYIGVYCGIGDNPPVNNAYNFSLLDSTATADIATLVCLSLQPVQVSIKDFSYKINNSPLLNDTTILPFFDVENVTGLKDINVTSSSEPIDGQDNSYVSAAYVSGRTVVIEGTIYTSGNGLDETVVDAFKSNIRPSGPIKMLPFYYKPNNVSTRVLKVYSANLSVDESNLNNTNRAPFQLQLLSEDSASYSPKAKNPTSSVSNGVTTWNGVLNNGNKDTFPVFYFTVNDIDTNYLINFISSEAKSRNLFAAGNAGVVTVDTSKVGQSSALGLTSILKLDMRSRTLTRMDPTGPVDVSSAITVRNWWGIPANTYTSISVGKATAAGNTNWSVVMGVQDAWY